MAAETEQVDAATEEAAAVTKEATASAVAATEETVVLELKPTTLRTTTNLCVLGNLITVIRYLLKDCTDWPRAEKKKTSARKLHKNIRTMDHLNPHVPRRQLQLWYLQQHKRWQPQNAEE